MSGATIAITGGPTDTTNAQGGVIMDVGSPDSYTVTVSKSGFTDHVTTESLSCGKQVELTLPIWYIPDGTIQACCWWCEGNPPTTFDVTAIGLTWHPTQKLTSLGCCIWYDEQTYSSAAGDSCPARDVLIACTLFRQATAPGNWNVMFSYHVHSIPGPVICADSGPLRSTPCFLADLDITTGLRALSCVGGRPYSQSFACDGIGGPFFNVAGSPLITTTIAISEP